MVRIPTTQEYTVVAWEMHRPAVGMAFPIVSHGFALVGEAGKETCPWSDPSMVNVTMPSGN